MLVCISEDLTFHFFDRLLTADEELRVEAIDPIQAHLRAAILDSPCAVCSKGIADLCVRLVGRVLGILVRLLFKMNSLKFVCVCVCVCV
jgi:hypothetical protein